MPYIIDENGNLVFQEPDPRTGGLKIRDPSGEIGNVRRGAVEEGDLPLDLGQRRPPQPSSDSLADLDPTGFGGEQQNRFGPQPQPPQRFTRVQNVGGNLIEETYDPNTGAVIGRRRVDMRDPDDVALAREKAELSNAILRQRLDRGSGGGGGRTQFASEAARDNAAAALAYAQANNIPLERVLREGIALGEVGGRPTLEAELGRGRLGLDTQRFGLEGELGRGRLGLDTQRFGLEQELGRGNLDLNRMQTENQLRIAYQRLGLDERTAAQQAQIAADRLGLEGELGRGQLDVSKQRLGLEQQLGTGRLNLDTELGRGNLQLGRDTLAQRGLESASDRAQRDALALGRVGGQDTLERELGTGNLRLNEQRARLEEILGLGNLSLNRAQTFGMDEGGRQTLQNVLGRAGLLGTLDGEQTLGGRQQLLTEQEAAFRRLSTPSAIGSLAGLVQRGLVPASALQSGDIGGLERFVQQPVGQQMARPGLTAQRPSPSAFTAGAPAPQMPRLGRGEGMVSMRPVGVPGGGQQPFGGQQQSQPLSFSLQQLKPLLSREREALGGFVGAQGQSLQDITERAQQDMEPLGQGFGRRGRVRAAA